MEKTFQIWLAKACLLILILFPISGMAELPLKYQLQPGEDIGSVLSRLGLKPIWSAKGSFAKTVEANPVLKKKYPNFNLPVYTWINIPTSVLPQSEDYKVHNGILEFSSHKSFEQVDDIHKVISLVNKKIARGGYNNLRDVVIHFHGDSKRKDSEQPLVINLNFYNNGESSSGHRSLAYQTLSQKNENSIGPAIKAHQLLASLSSHSLKIEGVSRLSRAKIFSDSGVSATVDWEQRWSESYSTALFMQGIQYEISNNSSTSIIDDGGSPLLNFGIRNNYKVLEALKLNVDISLADKYFINANSGSVLLSSESILSTDLGLHYQVFKFDGHSLFSGAALQYNFGKSASFAQIDSGFGYDADLEYHYKRNSHQFGAGINYGFMDQGSSQFNQEDTEIVLSILYRLSFGGQN